MRRLPLQSIAAVSVLVATIVLFVLYFQRHPDVLARLATLPLSSLALLFGLYAVFMVALIFIQRATITACELRLPAKENVLLTLYSSIINFFGPLQSGPGFRALYLKKRHNINLKAFTLATFCYYGFYAAFSGTLLLAAFIGPWALLLCVSLLVLPYALSRLQRFRALPLHVLIWLAAATLAQVIIISIIYLVELRSLGGAVSYSQVLVYTGAANFALFVSLTPGAIGFREAFLIFSQRLHGISNDLIITASLLDRSIYVSMLVVLAAVIFGLHANTVFNLDAVDKSRDIARKT
ncbi:MAG TPA: lysylphosphatidylglycerol synthase domain-containing protein [Candidatus Limnocylindrales bacterium]|nr:lysylphosphatidylglycerol synthase domain-containing protein [Candidatus Limnocylindrales bacterium]